ncbi:plant intracellular Ras-group-related LRR protein 8 isoform X2 [Malania oleifera]|uniref:plant intracellular Ras-group-related LRR protein 8 isoform X2 n=1 Tax=Malania oleifera TaxID=397392 RepID=UPI0025AEAD6D|nr:plant intracellular Ras-group-related LRR protein 8 isoform X2 [Malania oleifera]
MGDDGAGGDVTPSTNSTITVSVKFGGRSIRVSVSPNSTVMDLKSLLQPLTDVLPRGQKLIFKGKLLVDAMTLSSSEVMDGAKIMLVSSQGLHQGSGPITKEASNLPNLLRTVDARQKTREKIEAPIEKTQAERWKATGVIALSECSLKAIPDEVWTCGASARVLDISKNYIRDVPKKISCLSSIQKLLLNSNDILDESISWEGLTFLESLTILSLNQNHLTTLPSSLGPLTSLCQLHVANNLLKHLPAEIGLLTQLQVLKANNNRLSTIPTSIGSCSSLTEVDLSSNLLKELPETFGNLHNLKCTELSTLNLHCTEITMDLLRQIEGWEDFDQRRRLKHQKQLDFRVGGSAEFDEGADKRH